MWVGVTGMGRESETQKATKLDVGFEGKKKKIQQGQGLVYIFGVILNVTVCINIVHDYGIGTSTPETSQSTPT